MQINKVIFYLFLVVAIAYIWLFSFQHAENRKRACTAFLKDISIKLKKDKVNKIAILFDSSNSIVLTREETDKLVKHLEHANINPIKGHQYPVVEGCLQLIMESGVSYYYLVSVLVGHQSDLCLDGTNYYRLLDRSLHADNTYGHIFVPNLGKWFIDKVGQGRTLKVLPTALNKDLLLKKTFP